MAYIAKLDISVVGKPRFADASQLYSRSDS